MGHHEGRFYGCVKLGFPEVSNYDYESNVPIRGLENREFRWEEVAVESVFLLKEATTGNTFEGNTAISTLGITNATGVNFITTGSQVRTTTYTGWIVSGHQTVYIGQSGIYAYPDTLSGATGSFHAFPIHGDNSIGLYVPVNLGEPHPAIISSYLETGAEGPILQGSTHQVYLKAKLNHGSTGALKAYMRGYNGGAVAFYDYVSQSWAASAPTGSFAVGTNGYTEIRYNFVAATYPGSTPTGFDLVVSSSVTGSFITVDDIHVDLYMKKNAFVDFLVPTGYMVQVTPDLGWHNILDMFDGTRVNPHLKTIGPFTEDLGNLTDNLDNTVTATLDYSDFRNVTTNNYKKYLWRAVAISPNGIIGLGGYPHRFEFIGDQLDHIFLIDALQEDTTSSTKTITGRKGKNMTVLVDGSENHSGLTYPTNTTWSLTIELTSSERTVTLQGKDMGGGLSSIYTVTLRNDLYAQNTQAIWNVFDEHGLVTDLERLPSETNYDYRKRIQDAYLNRAGNSFRGIVNGATRELGLNKIDDALQITIARNQYNHYFAKDVQVEVTAYSLRIRTQSMEITEKLRIDPVYNTIKLTHLPYERPLSVTTELGRQVDITLFDAETIFDDYRSDYTYKIESDDFGGQFVHIKYPFVKEFLFKNYPTLGELVDAVNAYREESGNKTINIKLSSRLSGNENCLGLVTSSFTIRQGDIIHVMYSPLYLKRIADRGYRDYYISDEDQLLQQTSYYALVKRLKEGANIFWGSVEADRDRWDAAGLADLGLDSIPTLFDPKLAIFISSYTGERVRIESVTAWARNYFGYDEEFMQNAGVSSALFQPGVAHTNDLMPDVYTTFNYLKTVSSLEGNIGPTRNNNNVILFSGQR